MRLNNSNELAIDNKELSFIQKALREKGYEFYLKQNTSKYGILRNNIEDPSFDSFKVEAISSSQISINSGQALSKDSVTNELKLITNREQQTITVPNDNQWYLLKIKHEYSKLEEGIVSIDINGNLTGDLSCKFTETLRAGGPFCSVIRLYTSEGVLSVSNNYKYRVEQVISDTSAKLSGIFVNQSNLKYSIYGTFTPGYIPDNNEVEPFYHDSCIPFVSNEGLLLDDGSVSLIEDEEFFIARVKNTGSNIIVEDKRTSFWESNADFLLNLIDNENNPIIGIESIKFQNPNTALTHNNLNIAWAFRADTWSLNTNERKVIISGASTNRGGIYHSTNDFQDINEFGGWRLYIDSSKNYYKILNSIKNGSSIELVLDSLDISDFTYPLYDNSTNYLKGDRVNLTNTSIYESLIDSNIGWLDFGSAAYKGVYSNATTYSVDDFITYNGIVYRSLLSSNLNNSPTEIGSLNWEAVWAVFNNKILITPDVEEIEILVKVGSDLTVANFTEERFVFPINTPIGQLPILALDVNYDIYNLLYRYKNHNKYSVWKQINSDQVGYSNENNIATPYVADFYRAYFKPIMSSNALSRFRTRVDTGELLGVNVTNFSSLIYKNLVVGVDKQYQLFQDTILTLTNNVVINLSRFLEDGVTEIRDGVKFLIHIKQPINKSTYDIVFKQNAITTPGLGGDILKTITTDEYNSFGDNGVVYGFTYSQSESGWILFTQYIPSNKKFIQEIYIKDNQIAETPVLVNDLFANLGVGGAYIQNTNLYENGSPQEGDIIYNSIAPSTSYSSKGTIDGTPFELKIVLPICNVDRIYETTFETLCHHQVNFQNTDKYENTRTCISLSNPSIATNELVPYFDLVYNETKFNDAALGASGDSISIKAKNSSKAYIKVLAGEEKIIRGHIRLDSNNGIIYIQWIRLSVKEI